jgi:hypothetical protein
MDTFGESDKIENERPAKMAVPSRCLNSIEMTLYGQMAGEAAKSVPAPPFIDGDSGAFENADEFDGMSLRLALDYRDLLLSDVQEKFRRQIVIARELGPTRQSGGGPFTHEYEIACALEGVNPWPVGDRLVHEPRTEKIK